MCTDYGEGANKPAVGFFALPLVAVWPTVLAGGPNVVRPLDRRDPVVIMCGVRCGYRVYSDFEPCRKNPKKVLKHEFYVWGQYCFSFVLPTTTLSTRAFGFFLSSLLTNACRRTTGQFQCVSSCNLQDAQYRYNRNDRIILFCYTRRNNVFHDIGRRL